MRIFGGNLHIVLDARELSKLALNDDAMRMGVLDDALRKFDVLLEAQVRAVDHDGGEAVVDTGFACLEIRAVVEMQGDGQILAFERSLYEVLEVGGLRILSRTGGSLQDDGGFQCSRRFGDALDDLHVVDVEGADGVAALVGFLEHFFCSDEWHDLNLL